MQLLVRAVAVALACLVPLAPCLATPGHVHNAPGKTRHFGHHTFAWRMAHPHY